jgi:hypothetical protein
MKGILVFGGGGLLLLLSSYPTIDHPELVEKLHAKGLEKYIAYEVPVDRCRDLYGHRYRDIVRDLETSNDMRVLDFDGHHIFLNFSLRTLGLPYVHDDESDSAAYPNEPRRSVARSGDGRRRPAPWRAGRPRGPWRGSPPGASRASAAAAARRRGRRSEAPSGSPRRGGAQAPREA